MGVGTYKPPFRTPRGVAMHSEKYISLHKQYFQYQKGTLTEAAEELLIQNKHCQRKTTFLFDRQFLAVLSLVVVHPDGQFAIHGLPEGG